MINMTSSNQVDDKSIYASKWSRHHVEIIDFEVKAKPIIQEGLKIIDILLLDKKIILKEDISVKI